MANFKDTFAAKVSSPLTLSTTSPSTQTFNDTATIGTATTAAKADHKHAMPAAPTIITGNAGSATKLLTARNIRTNLASTSMAAFNGAADITPGVTGILGLLNGGLGNNTGTAQNTLNAEQAKAVVSPVKANINTAAEWDAIFDALPKGQTNIFYGRINGPTVFAACTSGDLPRNDIYTVVIRKHTTATYGCFIWMFPENPPYYTWEGYATASDRGRSNVYMRRTQAKTADMLTTPRTIGGVSFNGSANINLPGVNTAGNQNTSGNAATATKLATARTIGGVSFDGSAAINLPGVNTTGNQNTTGTAAGITGISMSAEGAVANALVRFNANGYLRVGYINTNIGIDDSTAVTGVTTRDNSGYYRHKSFTKFRELLGLGNTTGAVSIANGGTGQTTQGNAIAALMGGGNITTPTYVLTLSASGSWTGCGYASMANLKTALGLNNAALVTTSSNTTVGSAVAAPKIIIATSDANAKAISNANANAIVLFPEA